MIVRLEGTDSAATRAAQAELGDLVRGWGHDLTEQPVSTDAPVDSRRGVDPVALTALIVSLPSAALAVIDLTDRIAKRRRAKELIDRARTLRAHGVTLSVGQREALVEAADLDADQLLELLAEDGEQ